MGVGGKRTDLAWCGALCPAIAQLVQAVSPEPPSPSMPQSKPDEQSGHDPVVGRWGAGPGSAAELEALSHASCPICVWQIDFLSVAL